MTLNNALKIPARIAGFVRDVNYLFRTGKHTTISVAVEFKPMNQPLLYSYQGWFIMVHKQILQQLHRYHCAGLCIREGVVVAHEVIAAGCCDGLELMVGEPAAEVAA